MSANPTHYHRRSIRLKGYDYTRAGAYFITICTRNREYLFGEIINNEMRLNEFGQIVQSTWFDLVNHVDDIELGEFVVMPNHMHGIIIIVGAGSEPAPTEPAPMNAIPKQTPLFEIVRQLKTFSARRINLARNTQGESVWQRNYFEHIIRDEKSYLKISQYIFDNPARWKLDSLFDERPQ